MPEREDPMPQTDAGLTFPAERVKAFADAVVAIAMTLLILPLMEAASEASTGETDVDALTWLGEHQWPIITFLLSFGIVGMFWLNHHRLFSRVERVSTPLLLLLLLWLLTIVCLPVTTAMIGAFSSDDPVVKVTYIGTMALTGAASLAIRLYLHHRPDLHDATPAILFRGILADVVTTALFVLALIVATTIPAIGYFALFLLVLTGPIMRIALRATGRS